MHLTEQEQRQINELVAEVEAKSGAQLRLACHPEADAYPDIPWKAFALGAAAASLFIIVHEGLRPDWPSIHCAAFDVVVILGGGGATLARLTIFWPPVRTVARLYSICIPDSVLGDVSGRTDGALALLNHLPDRFPGRQAAGGARVMLRKAQERYEDQGLGHRPGFKFGGSGSSGSSWSSSSGGFSGGGGSSGGGGASGSW